MTTENSERSARLFFALWPDAQARAALAAWQPVLQELCGGKATPAANLHATLVFLGDVRLARLEALKLSAQEVQGKKFDLTCDFAHYWGHNHIVHAAPSLIPPQLAQLVSALEHGLRQHRFRFDQRAEYKPHITLLRHAKWSEASLPQMPATRWRIEEFSLVQSVADSEGVNYHALERFALR